MACVITYVAIVAVFLTAAVTTSVIDENKCSKFDYEYRVLERIIFLENRNADLERKQEALERKNEELGDIVKEQRLELERVNQAQDEDREKLKHTAEKTDNDLKEKMTQIVTKIGKLETTVEDQGKTIQQNDKVDNEDRGKIWSVVKKLEADVSKNDETHVSFSARIGHDKKYTKKETLVFKHVLNNDGYAYNATTGVFTAPVDGKYWFSISIAVRHPDTYAQVWLMKNNQHIVSAFPDTGLGSVDHWQTASVSTVMDLKRGNTVFCRWHGGNTSPSYNMYGTNLNTFSGALITQY